nr:hypothetical protein [Tanacetum cinerariifolium]
MNSFDCPPDSYHPPHPTYKTYSGDTCGNNSHFGYDCPPRFPLNYKPEPGYIQNYNSYPHDSPSFPQQYPCCEDCEKLPVCYDDDDDEERSNSLKDNIISGLPPCSAITPNEPVDSLGMGDEHLDTVPAMESDEFIKSCVKNLVPNPSESEGKNGCDVPACFTTFSNVLFVADYDFDSGDDQSFSDEDFLKNIYSNPMFDEEIIPMKINQHPFNAESDLIESMPNHDSSIIISSKIDSLFDEFAGELTLLKSIPPGIDETDCHPEKENHFTKRLLYDNSSPRPPKEFVSDNSDADNESFSPSPIPINDSDSRMEEINLTFTPDDPMPPGIEDDDYDSERDIPILEELLDNYSLSLPENESYHFDIPSPSRPPAKPPDGNTGILNIKMMGDISDQKVPIPNLMITRVSSQEKSPDLLPHQSLEIFQPSAECPMIINRKNIPVLDFSAFVFYSSALVSSWDEGHDEEEAEDELYRDVNINQGRGIQTTLEVEDSHVTLTPINPDGQQHSSSVSSQFVTSVLNPTLDVGMESIFETTLQMGAHTPTSVAPLPMSAPTITPSTISTITTTQQAPLPPTTAPSTLLQDLPNFGSLFGFDNRLKTSKANFSEFMQTNQFAGAVSAIPGIVYRYMDQRMNKAVQVAVQLQSDKLREEAQKENDEFLKTIDENMQKIIKEQTSYDVVADLSKTELKKILIEKMEGNKSIHRSNEQRNLYKALVEAYESNKIILDTFGEIVTLKKRRDDDADKDEEPSAGPDRGSKRRREGKEPESASAPTETATRSADSIQPWISDLAKQSDSRSSFNELMDTPVDFFNFLINRLNVDTLTPKLLAGPIYELLKGSCKSLQYLHNLLKPLPLIPNNRGHRVIPFDHFINNDLEYLRGGASRRKYTTSVMKTKAADYGHIKWIEYLVPRTMWIQEPIGYDKHALWGVSHWRRKRQQFYGFAVNRECARDVYSKRRIIAVTELKIVEWHNYKHLMITLTNLTVEERFAFNVCLRMFTRTVVIQRHMEDLQLGVESYQKKLNLTKPDTYRSDLKRKEAYIAYFNLRGFIYQNKDKKNRLMQIDKLHKFSDGTLIDVRTALDDHLKGILMQYLPQSI